jgi:hypothetical protein
MDHRPFVVQAPEIIVHRTLAGILDAVMDLPLAL